MLTTMLACSNASFGYDLSHLQLLGATKSKAKSPAACVAACCALNAGCSAWQYHVASTDPAHKPRVCWLWLAGSAPKVAKNPSMNTTDTWKGGSSVAPQLPQPKPPPVSWPPIPTCDGTDYAACRKQLWKYVFNTTTGELPSKVKPDYITEMPDWQMHGIPGPGQGTGVSNVSWRMGLQKLQWTIGLPGGGMRDGMLRLNSTVYFARNTTGDAPSNSPPVPMCSDPHAGAHCKTDSVHAPDKGRPGFNSWEGKGPDGKAGSDTLIIHHNGHGPCNGGEPSRSAECTDCTPNFDTAQDWFNQLGYDAMEVFMPGHGCNRLPAKDWCSPKHCVSNRKRGFDCSKCEPMGKNDSSMVSSHQWFDQIERQGDDAMRYFLEPIVLAVNYGKALGYKHIVMAGLSGGGWTTTISAAIDPRITLSMPIAGSMPKVRSRLFPHFTPDMPGSHGVEGGGGDWEQDSLPVRVAGCSYAPGAAVPCANLPGQETGGRPMYTACGWACMYALAATPAATRDPPRFALQMVHQWDSCCFQAGNLHANITQYNKFVQSQLTDGLSWFQTSANLGNYHEINYRDKVTLGVMIERLRREGGLKRSHFDDLPFNVVENEYGDGR